MELVYAILGGVVSGLIAYGGIRADMIALRRDVDRLDKAVIRLDDRIDELPAKRA